MKMMPIPHFDSIEEYLDSLPENQQQITKLLRNTVYDCLPEVSEKWNGKFLIFSNKSRICIIAPLGGPLENVKQEGVRLAFVKGKLLNDETGYFDHSTRAKTPIKTFLTIQEIDQELLRAYLYAAIELDSKKV